ncbi:uncharacterized protein FA14DRAFT_162507, partial [Meira miltonrushii]
MLSLHTLWLYIRSTLPKKYVIVACYEVRLIKPVKVSSFMMSLHSHSLGSYKQILADSREEEEPLLSVENSAATSRFAGGDDELQLCMV